MVGTWEIKASLPIAVKGIIGYPGVIPWLVSPHCKNFPIRNAANDAKKSVLGNNNVHSLGKANGRRKAGNSMLFPSRL